MMDYAEKAWLNGEFTDFDKLTFPIQTYGLHYGASVYEGIRVYNSKAFKLKQHIERLFVSADLLKMKLNYSTDEVCKAIETLIITNQLEGGYIRPIVWRGAGDLLISSFNKPEFAIFTWHRMSPFIDDVKDKKPLRLTVSKLTRYNPESYPVGAKIGGLYASNSVAKYIAHEEGYDDAIMLTHKGIVAESVTANIFVVKDGVLFTPTEENILNGITRQLVIELAKEHNIEIKEMDFDLSFLEGAQEVFLTGTACEIAPVASINNMCFVAGKFTQTLYNAFIDHIKKETL